jgi:hypothetical protein
VPEGQLKECWQSEKQKIISEFFLKDYILCSGKFCFLPIDYKAPVRSRERSLFLLEHLLKKNLIIRKRSYYWDLSFVSGTMNNTVPDGYLASGFQVTGKMLKTLLPDTTPERP